MNLDPAEFDDEGSGFHAVLYKNTITGKYVLAYKGTDPSITGDDITDAAQALGVNTRQYDMAIDLARHVNRAAGGNISYTGHSLGGGLAAAGSLATNRPAITFNAATVSQETLDREGVHPAPGIDKKLINSFYIPGEPLSATQESRLAAMAGGVVKAESLWQLHPATGPAQGTRIPIDQVGNPPAVPNKGGLFGGVKQKAAQILSDAEWMHSIDRFTESMK